MSTPSNGRHAAPPLPLPARFARALRRSKPRRRAGDASLAEFFAPVPAPRDPATVPLPTTALIAARLRAGVQVGGAR